MNIATLIPARSGSKSLKLKNIYPLKGIPLIAYSIRSAMEVSTDIFVSSDSQRILDEASNYGAKPLSRPQKYSDDSASTEIVLKHANDELNLDSNYDLVLYLSACEPLRPKGTILRLLDRYLESSSSIDSIFHGRPTHRHYWSLTPEISEKPIFDWMQDYSPRQEAHNRLLLECTGYGLITNPNFWANGKRFGGKCEWIEIPETVPDVDIHTQSDIELIEALTDINPNLLP